MRGQPWRAWSALLVMGNHQSLKQVGHDETRVFDRSLQRLAWTIGPRVTRSEMEEDLSGGCCNSPGKEIEENEQGQCWSG